jgi:TetR/AcrR family transcriptional regulator, cholesterol catabolism regulator
MTTDISRRQQIEDAASTLFRDRGYAATSVRDIAQALDMQGGSLYAHVASKEDMLWSIVLRAADRFNREVGPLAAGDLPAKAKLQAMIGAHVGVVTSSQKDSTVFLHEWRFLNDERRAQVGQRRDDYEGLFRSVIADGVSANEFRPVDPRLTAMAILSALNGIATWYRPDGPMTAEDIADQHASLFIDGLTSDEPNFMMRTFS